jgi:hypothetical protein
MKRRVTLMKYSDTEMQKVGLILSMKMMGVRNVRRKLGR